jgi:F-type H+-transporting ATPase subunit delta
LAENTIRVKRYSKAVFEIALESNQIDEWLRDLQKIAAMASISEFAEVMGNPKFSFENKSKLLVSYLQGINSKALNLASILVRRGNFSIVKDIYSEYQVLLDQYKGVAQAEVTTAMTMDENQITKITSSLANLTGKKVVVSKRVDPRIIGGMVARVDGKIIDGSTRSQLAALKNEIINTGSQTED